MMSFRGKLNFNKGGLAIALLSARVTATRVVKRLKSSRRNEKVIGESVKKFLQPRRPTKRTNFLIDFREAIP